MLLCGHMLLSGKGVGPTFVQLTCITPLKGFITFKDRFLTAKGMVLERALQIKTHPHMKRLQASEGL